MALTVSSPLQRLTYDPVALAQARSQFAELTNMREELRLDAAQNATDNSNAIRILSVRLDALESTIANGEALAAAGPVIVDNGPTAPLDTVLGLPNDLIGFAVAINEMVHDVHLRNVNAGWWTDPKTGLPKERNVGEMLMLDVTELSEGMEGARKSLMDDKLPHRPMLEVELADSIIRSFDLAGGHGYDLGGAVAEKLVFNSVRPDHKIEARLAVGGKMA